jgi:hypothetical protein
MKNLLQKILVLCLVVIPFVSCFAQLKVKVPSMITEKIDRIVLIATQLSIQQPVVPLIDAAVLNDKTNSISTEIQALFNDNINNMRDTTASLLVKNLKCKVIYGEELHGTSGFMELKDSSNFKEYLATENEHFPEILTAKDDINPFKFTKGKIDKYFKDPNNYVCTIVGICKDLNIDYVAVSQTKLLPAPGSMIYSSSISLFTYLYIFDKNGECIASGNNYSTISKFKANEIESYREALESYSKTLDPIIAKIAVKLGY